MVKILQTEVGRIGFGLMGFTWRPQATPFDDAIRTMKVAVSRGAVFWNGGTFYGPPNANSLHLINAYFTRYPEDVSKVQISIKGPRRGDQISIREVMDQCLTILDGKKFLDLYQCARVDPSTPIEDTIETLKSYITQETLGGITLSEPSVAIVRRAAKVHKIAFVEVEFSMFALEPIHNGLFAACAELGIPIVAYSPLGRGFLTGAVQRADELPDGDIRKPFPRIQPGNFERNLELAKAIESMAAKKGCKPSQFALAWVIYHSGKAGFPEIIPIPGSTTAARVEENTEYVTLTEEEFVAANQAVAAHEIVGARYPS